MAAARLAGAMGDLNGNMSRAGELGGSSLFTEVRDSLEPFLREEVGGFII